MRASGFVCSSQRLSDELGWSPQHALDDTLKWAVEGYRASGQL